MTRAARGRSRALAIVVRLVVVVGGGVGLSPRPGFADWRERLDEGIASFQRGEYVEAIGSFEKALGEANDAEATAILKEHLGTSYGALGAKSLELGEYREAEDLFRKGLEYADNYYSRFGLGFIHFQRLEDAKALEHLEASLAHQPDFAGTHKLLGLLAYRRGESALAIEELEKARRGDPEDKETRFLLESWKREGALVERFREQPTAHFRVRIDPEIPGPNSKVLLRELESVYREIGDRLGLWPEEPVIVVLFSEENFHKATGTLHWVGGLYDGQLKMPVTAKPLGDGGESLEAVERVLRHEYAHVIVRRLAPECPVWLNEGIAQHFEEQVPDDALRARLRDMKNPLPFGRIPARLWEIQDEALARKAYIQALGFVRFLVAEHHEFRLRLLLRSMARDHSVQEAFAKTYGRSLEELESFFWESVGGISEAAEGGDGTRASSGVDSEASEASDALEASEDSGRSEDFERSERGKAEGEDG